MKKKIKDTVLLIRFIFIYLIIYLMFIFLGFILGMAYQQVLFTREATHILSYSDIEINVNLNSTKLAEELNKTFIPFFEGTRNQTKNQDYNFYYHYEQVNLTEEIKNE